MIRLRSRTAALQDGCLEGVVRDDRLPGPDGVPTGFSCSIGDPVSGPAVTMSITRRLYPKRAPVHLHKTDTFRMALENPIVVGRTSYPHGHFRVQQSDTYYGPESWTDEVGTNQVLVMADRRGGKPYLPTPELQALSDLGTSAEEDIAPDARQLRRDADVTDVVLTNLGAQFRAGHVDGSFDDTSRWSSLQDGSRLGVVLMGDPDRGPVVLLWDRPLGSGCHPAFRSGTDLVRLVVDGALEALGTRWCRLAFRIQEAGTSTPRTRPTDHGAKELWILADRRAWTPRLAADSSDDERLLFDEAVAVVDRTREEPAPQRPLARAKPRAATSPEVSSAPFSVQLALSDSDFEPYYARIIDHEAGAVVAFTDPHNDRAVIEATVARFRRGHLEVDRIYDRRNACWFFRLKAVDGPVLFRGAPRPSEEDVDQLVARIQASAPYVPIIDDIRFEEARS